LEVWGGGELLAFESNKRIVRDLLCAIFGFKHFRCPTFASVGGGREGIEFEPFPTPKRSEGKVITHNSNQAARENGGTRVWKRIYKRSYSRPWKIMSDL
jgi:hypothetical protein